MSAGVKVEREDVWRWADIMRNRLVGAGPDSPCIDGQVCGSVAREQPWVGDVEIVLLPRFDPKVKAENLLGERIETDRRYARLEARIDEMIAEGLLKRGEVWGMKQRKLIPRAFEHFAGFRLELYIGDEDNYGNICALRNGPWELSKALLSSKFSGGLLPPYLQHEDGYLWRMSGGVRAGKISCRHERTFFNAIGVEWIPARERTSEKVEELRAKLLAKQPQRPGLMSRTG